MLHSRSRHTMPLFLKRLQLFRVVAIQGCRQSGKSYFAQHLVKKACAGSRYLTFDDRSQKSAASDRPDVFLEQSESARPLLIDEAQKVPDIFDAVKFRVDANPRPGQYVLLGSTEFSKLLKIRESLTGRMGRLRLYSMNIAECNELGPGTAPLATLFHAKPRIKRTEVLRHLSRGGLPGIFAVRSEGAAADLLRDWVDLTVHRDLLQFPGIAVDGDLAFEVLNQLALCDEPTASEVAKKLRKDTRAIQKILDLLETLFVVHVVRPHKLGTGKPYYYFCDVSLVGYFEGSFERQLQTWLVHEQLSQRAYRDDRDHRLTYYRTAKGSTIDLVVEKIIGHASVTAIKIISREKFDRRDFEVLKAFQRKCEKNSIAVKLAAFGPISTRIEPGLEMHPWEALG